MLLADLVPLICSGIPKELDDKHNRILGNLGLCVSEHDKLLLKSLGNAPVIGISIDDCSIIIKLDYEVVEL